MKKKLRRNGLVIMGKLITLLGSLSLVMLLAVFTGVLGFFSSMGVTIFGSIGIAKYLNESMGISTTVINLSYTWIIILTISCGVLRGILRYVEQYFNHYIAFRLLAVLRDKIFGALRVLCPAKLETKKKGSIISMVTSDIETLEVFYAHTISPICIAILVSISTIIFVSVYTSFYLALVALLGYIFIAIVIPVISSKKMKESGVKYRNEFASFNSFFLDSIKGVKEIVLNRKVNKRKEEVDERSSKMLLETKKMKKNAAFFTSLTTLSVSIFIILTLVVGILLVHNNMLTIGKMIIGTVTVFSSFGPVIAIASLPTNLTQTFASGDRVLNLLEEKPAVLPIENQNNFVFNDLKVSNLDFSYEENIPILSNINMSIKNGEIIGIVGKSGIGKSTLLKLLLRFFLKENGNISYNDIDIDYINTHSLYENVTLVSQSTYLFNDTILNNLLLAKEDATEEEIIKATKEASIYDFIMSLPEGFNTKIGSLENNLSSGEKQRLGLAIAFLRGSKLILLDEPTSNVDSINEGIILKALKDKKKEKSIILVSHRESTMSIVDRVYKFEDKTLKEVK